MGSSQTFIEAVIDGTRRIIERWVISRTPLINDAHAGDSLIYVHSTRRFNVGDQFLINNNAEDMENSLYVLDIPDRNTITLADKDGNPTTLKWDWPLANGALATKTLDDQLVKAVFFGEPDVIEDLPAITVSMTNRNSEWYALRTTKERYNLEITVYVSGTTQEEGDRFLSHMVDIIQYGLKRNFYPLLNDYKTYSITADVISSDTFIKVADTTPFGPGQQIILEDEYNISVLAISNICDSTTIQTAQPIGYDFLFEDCTLIQPRRLPFQSWPSDIQFGKIKKGTLLKAAVISYFIEEMEDHLEAGLADPNLS